MGSAQVTKFAVGNKVKIKEGDKVRIKERVERASLVYGGGLELNSSDILEVVPNKSSYTHMFLVKNPHYPQVGVEKVYIYKDYVELIPKDSPATSPCSCSITTLMSKGCVCGGV